MGKVVDLIRLIRNSFREAHLVSLRVRSRLTENMSKKFKSFKN